MSSSEDTNVVLEEYDDGKFFDDELDNLQYPAIFLSGISTMEEIKFFKDRAFNENYALPIYSKIEGQYYKIGMLDLSLDSLLSLRSVFNYELELRADRDNSTILDLNDPETLIKFIKF